MAGPGFAIAAPQITLPPPSGGGSATGVGYADQVGNGVPPGVVQVLIAATESAERAATEAGRQDLVLPIRGIRSFLALALSHPNADGLVPSTAVRQAINSISDAQVAQDVRFFLHAAAPTVDFQQISDRIDQGYYIGTRARDAQLAADTAARAAQAAHLAAMQAGRQIATDQQRVFAAQRAADAERARQDALAAQQHADRLAADHDDANHGLLIAGGLLGVALLIGGVLVWRPR